MGLTVILEDENGDAIQILLQELQWDGLTWQERNKFRLLKYIDSYGDTTFNSLQLNNLRADFEQLKLVLVGQTHVIQRIIKLIQECQDQIHTYIKFYGD